jgi:mannan endo-1,4-beta-mannosidase
MTQVLSRVNKLTGVAYKDDPTILAFELGNELRCVGSIPTPSNTSFKCDSTVLTAWVDEMSTFLHNLAPNHLISVGDEGFFKNGPNQYPGVYSNVWDGSAGVDAEALARLPNIHLIGLHSVITCFSLIDSSLNIR